MLLSLLPSVCYSSGSFHIYLTSRMPPILKVVSEFKFYPHVKGPEFWHEIISFSPGEEQLQVLIILTSSKHI